LDRQARTRARDRGVEWYRKERAGRALPRGRTVGTDPVGTAFIVMLIALLIASVLNGDRLALAARALPIGPTQSVAKVASAAPAWLNRVLFIDRLSDGIGDVVMGPFEQKPDRVVRGSSETTVSIEPTASLEPTVTPPRVLSPSVESPVSLIIHGDSMTEAFGKYLRADLNATGLFAAVHDFRFSSGLARPDYFDWPAHLRETMASQNPDVVIMMFGANDGQNVKPAGTVLEFGSPEWATWYAERVGEAMDIVDRDGRRVYWVSLPNARDAAYANRMKTLNDVFAAEAAKRPGITYVDAWALFAGEDGSYQAYLPDAQGTVRLMRQDDGIHLSIFGAHKLSDHLEHLLANDVGIMFPAQ